MLAHTDFHISGMWGESLQYGAFLSGGDLQSMDILLISAN